LAAYVGLSAGRVRLASFVSALSTFIPRAVARLAASHPGVQVGLIDAHSDDALQMLVSGEVDIVVGFHTDEDVAGPGLRSVFLGEDPIYLLVPDGAPTSMSDLRTQTGSPAALAAEPNSATSPPGSTSSPRSGSARTTSSSNRPSWPQVLPSPPRPDSLYSCTTPTASPPRPSPERVGASSPLPMVTRPTRQRPSPCSTP
jgi:DNA-binding transcriptional LysR family regulator